MNARFTCILAIHHANARIVRMHDGNMNARFTCILAIHHGNARIVRMHDGNIQDTGYRIF